MKKWFMFICSIFIAFVSAQKDELYPQVFFDKKLAASMLAPGKSTIEGVAFTKQKDKYGMKPIGGVKHFAPKGTVIMLFPITPYFEEFYKTRKKYENKNTNVFMSEDAFAHRREALTDEYGRFKFSNVKPGKYYIETIVNFTATGSYKEQTGTSTSYNYFGQALYSNPIYQTFFYNYASANRESKFVEIKSDGQLLEIKL